MIIIDAEEENRDTINNLLARYEDFEVQGLGKDGYDAIRLITLFKPDIAVLDINLDIVSGLDILPLLKRQSPATLVVVLASKLNDKQISRALSSKIAGFLLRDQDFDQLPVILKDIHFGRYYMNPQISTRIFHIFSERFGKGRRTHGASKMASSLPVEISKTEFQIISYVGAGLSNREIAENLHLRSGTVRNYISSAIHKTGVRDRTQLAIYALKNDLVNTGNYS
jgi:DNA-binding NarL/FixJ family response regulator